jgi:hypothetical protein
VASRDDLVEQGYALLPGLLRRHTGWLADAFDEVFARHGIVADGVRRYMIVPFIDHDVRLSALLDDPAVAAAFDELLGPRWLYLPGDGNYFQGDTGWHQDGTPYGHRFYKAAVYLQPVDADTGGLRVVPGSHRRELPIDVELAKRPWAAVPSTPGDVVVFDHRIWHSSAGGGDNRRMFTMNLAAEPRSDAAVADVAEYLRRHCAYTESRQRRYDPDFALSQCYGDVLLATASSERMEHLRLGLSLDPRRNATVLAPVTDLSE